jgi:hypothetical protein
MLRETVMVYTWYYPMVWGKLRRTLVRITYISLCVFIRRYLIAARNNVNSSASTPTDSTKSQAKSHYDRQPVGQSVLVSSPIWGPRPEFCYCQPLAVLSMWAAILEESMGLSFTTVRISSTHHLYLQFCISAFYIVSYQESGSLRIHTIYRFTCNSSTYVCTIIQVLCSCRLGKADHALTHAAHVTTAASSLEWSYLPGFLITSGRTA